jgi:hypothetical protein
MTDRLVTRREVRELYVFQYCGETFRRWEKPCPKGRRPALLFPIKAAGLKSSSRVYYRLSNVIAVFGPVPTH